MSASVIAAIACGAFGLLALVALIGVVVFIIKKKPHEALAAGLSEVTASVANKWDEIRSAWAAAAEARGLDFKPDTGWDVGRISGELDGRRVTATVEHRAHRKHGSRVSLVSTELGFSLGVGLRAASSALATDALFGAITGNRVTTGDAAFDNAWKVFGSDAATTAALLGAPVRAALMAHLFSEGSVEVNDERIIWRKNGYVSTTDALLAVIDAQRAIAEALVQATTARHAE